jgi:sugar/nucleoside kinase (ribokinase family)
MNVVSVGDLVLDIILSAKLPVTMHQDVPYRRVEPGGAGNFTIAARHLGLNVMAVGAVGADVFGRHILDILSNEGVNISGVVAVPGSTTTLVIALTDQLSGDHVFIGHYGVGPEVPYPDHIDELIEAADAFFIQGYTLAERRVVPMALRALQRAEKLNVPIYLDVGPLIAQVSPERTRRVLERAAVILMTEEEAPLVSEGRSGEHAYEYLLASGPQTLVVKRGGSGCLLVTREQRTEVPGFPANIVDTVGAGDCFDAAFIAGQLWGFGLRDSALLANAMGAASVQKMGAGSNAPTCPEVVAVLAQAGVILEFSC